jgi:ubiquinone/menaquinone biosynthesis C-methylase UbiE
MNESRSVKDFYNKDYYGAPPPQRKVRTKSSPYASYDARLLDRIDLQPGEAVLDIACGAGRTLSKAEERFQGEEKLCGIDISEVALRHARDQLSTACLICGDVNIGLPFSDNIFDKVMCLGSLEHFQRQALVVREIRRVLRPIGKALFLVPNDDYILHHLGYETDQQPVIKRCNLQDWLQLLSQNGLCVLDVEKENHHLKNLSESSSYIKHLLKLLIHPLVDLLPMRWSFNFVIVCASDNERAFGCREEGH